MWFPVAGGGGGCLAMGVCGRGHCHHSAVSVPGGTSGGTHGNGGCGGNGLHRSSQGPGQTYLWCVGVGQSSLCFTSAAFAPRGPSHAGAGSASCAVIPVAVKVGRCSAAHRMWGL